LTPTPPPPDWKAPDWREIAEFIDKQTTKDRTLIDGWFQLATKVLTVLIVAVFLGIGLFGWKTLADARDAAQTEAKSEAAKIAPAAAENAAKAVAEPAAREAAQQFVRQMMQQPAMQKLVQDTARAICKRGVSPGNARTGPRTIAGSYCSGNYQKNAWPCQR